MGKSACPTQGGNWGGGWKSSCKSKSLNFPLPLDIASTKKLSFPIILLITDYILEEKVSLIVFRKMLPKILPAIFSCTIMTYLKKVNRTSLLIQNSVHQDFLPELYPGISLPTKMSPPLMLLCSTHLVQTVLPSPKPLWETFGMVENIKQPKIYSFPATRKISLNRFTSSAIISVIHSPIKQQFSCNHPMQTSFLAVIISVVSFSQLQALCTHMSC